MKQIKDFLFSLPISAELQEELASEQLLHQHRFYLQLTRLLAPAFPLISEAELDDLSGYSYLYFRFLLGLDSLLDAPAAGGAWLSSQRLFAYLELHEQAVRGLAQLFPATDEFWPALAQCKQEYAAANLREQQLTAQRGPYSAALFEEVAAGKSAVCYAMTYALRSLGRDAGPVSELRHCLRELHIGLQYLDDLDDFRLDWQQGQFTYAHFLVESYLQAHGLAAAELPVSELHRYLYTSGVAQQQLAQAAEHLAASLAIAHSLGLAELEQYLHQQATKCLLYQEDIDRLLLKTRIKASKSRALRHATPPALSTPVLHTARHDALGYLSGSRDAQGCWADFMTSAGQSRLWATAYAGLQLAETKAGRLLAQQALDAAIGLPGAYNESMLQDGDSTTFALGLRQQLGVEATPAQLRAWLAFMDADGGWVTYRDGQQLRQRLELPASVRVADWLSPKPCVTAAAAYVLRQYPGLAPQYQASCHYLARQQHPEGYWASYWWTSPIYATAYAVLALAPLATYEAGRAAALGWLATQQAPDGAWHDASRPPQASAFFTALAIKALLSDDTEVYAAAIAQGVAWLLAQQTTDGSWPGSRCLRIPATDVADPNLVPRWRASSFGVNVLVDDHHRIFTTSTVLNALSLFADQAVLRLAAHH